MEVRHVSVASSAVATRLVGTLRFVDLPGVGPSLRTAVVGATNTRDRADTRVGAAPTLAASVDPRRDVVGGRGHRVGTRDLPRGDVATRCVVPTAYFGVDDPVDRLRRRRRDTRRTRATR